jgi:hypothetical protein
LAKLDGMICSIYIDSEDVKANIETLKEIGVEISADNLDKLGTLICSDKIGKVRSNIAVLKEI